MSIVCMGQEELNTQALLDTGADGPNFVHSTLASQLLSSGIPTQPISEHAVASVNIGPWPYEYSTIVRLIYPGTHIATYYLTLASPYVTIFYMTSS